MRVKTLLHEYVSLFCMTIDLQQSSILETSSPLYSRGDAETMQQIHALPSLEGKLTCYFARRPTPRLYRASDTVEIPRQLPETEDKLASYLLSERGAIGQFCKVPRLPAYLNTEGSPKPSRSLPFSSLVLPTSKSRSALLVLPKVFRPTNSHGFRAR
jgi:hypothetical protein